jgi:hypothetical protein
LRLPGNRRHDEGVLDQVTIQGAAGCFRMKPQFLLLGLSSFHIETFLMLSIPVEGSKPTKVSITKKVDQEMVSSSPMSDRVHTNTETGDIEAATPVLGKGEINEKTRFFGKPHMQHPRTTSEHYNPKENLSHLLHAIVGLDRYPNYLLRWTQNEEKDIAAVEEALEEQLQKVRHQRDLLRKRRKHFSKVCNDLATVEQPLRPLLQPPQTWDEVRDNILHPKVFNAIFRSKMFWDSNNTTNAGRKEEMITVQDVIDGKIVVHLDPHLVYDLLDEEMPDVYSFPLLSAEVCLCKKTFPLFADLEFVCYYDCTNDSSLAVCPTTKKMVGMMLVW